MIFIVGPRCGGMTRVCVPIAQQDVLWELGYHKLTTPEGNCCLQWSIILFILCTQCLFLCPMYGSSWDSIETLTIINYSLEKRANQSVHTGMSVQKVR